MAKELPTVLRDARMASGLTIQDMAHLCDSNIATISRVERGLQVPHRELARALFDLFEGILTLGEIYDPGHEANRRELDDRRTRAIRQLARKNQGWNRRLPTAS